MQNHVMLDLETWGTEPGCAIRSIGAVIFNPFDDEAPRSTYYANITDASCEAAGLTRDPSTEKWWAEQQRDNPEALYALATDRIPLAVAAEQFNIWWQTVGAQFVWSHGANFDEPVWRVAAKAVGYKIPWAFRSVRDTRTLFALAGFDFKMVPVVGTLHNALDDCKTQAIAVQRAHKMLMQARAAA